MDSPISRNEKETLSKIQGDGAGNLSMELTMPLFKKEKPEVIGYFQGSGTLFKMADLIPPVSNYNVKFEFNENTIRSGSGNALFLGKPLVYSASLLKDGGLGIDLKGGFKSEALVESFESRFFRYFVGDANWNGRISFRNIYRGIYTNILRYFSTYPKDICKSDIYFFVSGYINT